VTSPVANYYVYCLYRPDGHPFYVGKGSGKRLHDHERDKNNPHKRNIIALATRCGQEIDKRKLVEGLQEEDAYELERFLIQEIGREPQGPLVNLTDGGDGFRGLLRTPQHRAAISIGLKGKPKSAAGKVACVENARKATAALIAMPKEWHLAKQFKAHQSTTAQQRSAAQKRAWSTRIANDPNELERVSTLGKSKMTPELNQRAIAAAAARSPEDRSDCVKRANASRTPEQRRLIALKSWETRRRNGK
jgi:hypothetical protein